MPVTEASAAPAFIRPLLQDEQGALAILEREHIDYSRRKQSWEVLLNAFEGGGGFLDGSYLWEYPREDRADYLKRQQMARYHNYLESLIDLYVRFIWTQGVSRESANEDLNAWLQDVDGQGTTVDQLLKRALAVGEVHGHAGVLVDKTPDEPTGQSKADELARPIATVFTALGIQDWRFDADGLAAVKLREAAPVPGIAEKDEPEIGATQYLLWDREGWARFDSDGMLVNADVPNLGIVPLVILRPKPSYTSPMVGRPLISNANILQAMFNRDSEEDEVLRAQAFSVLTVEVPTDGDPEAVKRELGSVMGAAKAIVVRGKATYQTPSMDVPAQVRENRAYLVQEIYRAAHVKYRREGGQAESGESIRLQYTELNEALQGTAKALAQAEREIVHAYFAWTTTTPEQAMAAFDAAGFSATYPTEFFLDDLMADLESWAEAIRMNLGPTMAKRIKQRAVRRLDPSIPADVLETIDKEIDGQKDEELNPSLVPPDMGDPEGDAIGKAAGE